MAGSLLGPDQINAVNDAYPRLLAHIRALLAADHSGYGLLKVHFLTEYLDTTELFQIFQPISFLSAAEKRAYVRAAIYEVLSAGDRPAEHDAPVSDIEAVNVPATGPVPLKEFVPPAFKLNVTTVSSLKEKQV